jgi:hypothetical protein
LTGAAGFFLITTGFGSTLSGTAKLAANGATGAAAAKATAGAANDERLPKAKAAGAAANDGRLAKAAAGAANDLVTNGAAAIVLVAAIGAAEMAGAYEPLAAANELS